MLVGIIFGALRSGMLIPLEDETGVSKREGQDNNVAGLH